MGGIYFLKAGNESAVVMSEKGTGIIRYKAIPFSAFSAFYVVQQDAMTVFYQQFVIIFDFFLSKTSVLMRLVHR